MLLQQQQQKLQCRQQWSIFRNASTPPQLFLAASPERRIKMHSLILSCYQPTTLAKFIPPQSYNTPLPTPIPFTDLDHRQNSIDPLSRALNLSPSAQTLLEPTSRP